MPFEQQFVHGLNMQRAAQQGEVFIPAQAFSLTFTEFKVFQIDPQQDYPTGLTAPFPVISPEQHIRPIRPPVSAKPVEHHGVHRLHGYIFLNLGRIEGDILKDGECF